MTSRTVTTISPIAFGLGAALALGALLRLLPAVPGPLTSGDGGLIVVMVDDIRKAGMGLPEFTTYNDAGIPFAYPPLGLLACALLAELLNLTSLESVRLTAFLLSVITLGVFAVLARRVLPPVAAVSAVLMYALMPHAFDTVVAGGGVTRGPGLLMALLCLIVAASPKALTASRAVGLGVLLGLTALSHPQAALYATAGSAILALRPGEIVSLIRHLAIAVAVAGLVVVPWLFVIVGEHGWSVVFAAGHRWNALIGVTRLFGLNFSGSAFADLFLVFGTLGLVIELLRHRWRFPLLLFSLVFAGEEVYLGAVPWALLGGLGLWFLIERTRRPSTVRERTLWAAIAAAGLFLALISSMGSVVDETSRLQHVSADQASAMSWVATETEDDTRFIVAAVVYWGGDEIGEWFPAIADRQSVGTVQGTEWLGRDAFRTQLRRNDAILGCTRSTDRCMADWAEAEGLGDAWLFIPKGQVNGPLSPPDCCPALRETVQSGTRFEVVYDGPGATIARPVNAED